MDVFNIINPPRLLTHNFWYSDIILIILFNLPGSCELQDFASQLKDYLIVYFPDLLLHNTSQRLLLSVA